MRFAINTPNFGLYSNVHLLAELAHEAEEAGWDGFFIWDHIGAGPEWSVPLADPWVALTAMAMATKRIKIGPMVTPLPRRRPWKVAREAVTLDHVSEGRLILGVGMGSDQGREFSCFREETDDKRRGDMLDEGLEILTRLWSGETFSYQGTHYQLSEARFLPTPVQHPRIPIWLAGSWPNKKPFRRAAKFDGICPMGRDQELTPEDWHAIIAYLTEHRATSEPFDVIVAGHTTGTDKEKDRATISSFAEVGATWWQEGFDWTFSLEHVRKRIRLGPPEL
jgi:alkanesulfonate monooxygenase SsuD/methylene tetrahydromethanopterin reductase-like flavin-dependent oxidoreductase (luciferase family)